MNPLIPKTQITSKHDTALKQQKKAQQTKTFVGFKPHPGQLKIIKAIEENGIKHTVLSIGRQFGKSIMARNLCYKWAINTENQDIYYVTPTYRLAKNIFESIEKEIGKSGVLKEGGAGINRTDLVFTFRSGSKIRLLSGERPDNARGISCTHLIIDEMAFCKRELWEAVLAPTTKVKGKKVLFISSPAGKNHFYELFLRGQNKESGFQSFSAPSIENPFIDPNELEEAKKNDTVWRSEYLAEFVDDSLTVFPGVKSRVYGALDKVLMPEIGMKYYCGIDLARKNDYTVITVLDNNRKIVDLYRIRYTNWSFIIEKIVEMLVFWKPSLTYIEDNHNDRVIEELIDIHRLKNIAGFNTNVGTKNPMIQDLVFAFEKGLISIPDIDYLISELESFTFTYNRQSGRLSYGAPSSLHDDSVISLALANSAWKFKHPKTPSIIWERL